MGGPELTAGFSSRRLMKKGRENGTIRGSNQKSLFACAKGSSFGARETACLFPKGGTTKISGGDRR